VCVTNNPAEIPNKELPEEYIIKPNHASGRYIIVEKGDVPDWKKIIAICEKWLRMPYGLAKHEWAYQQIKPMIVVERLLRDEDGKVPMDYKLFMFQGKCKLVQVNCDRFSMHTKSLFDENWKYLDIMYNLPKGFYVEKPANFSKMLTVAEKLSKPFDFVRVDFYSIGNKLFVGELTNYPESGMGRFYPQSFDVELGEYLVIQPKYWENRRC
jgi:hypothetical protein